jgi:integrative and conjugative element protein (TIGR02256 family)
MGKRKGKGKKKNKRKISSSKGILHREAECARKIIQYHPSVNGKVGVPQSQTNGGFEINFEMSVSLPSRSNKKGMTETGVKSKEPVILRFPPTYPFQAPAILLRPDFNRSFPHIYPALRSDKKSHIVPCVYDGPLDDLLHQEGDGLSEILNQLSEWLAKAAINDLIDPRQGWEPIRRDDTFGWVVYDLTGFRALVRDKEGTSAYQCRFLEWKERKEQLYFVGGINHRRQRDVTPWLIKNSFFTDKSLLMPSYVSLMIFAWSDSGVIVDQYLPEGIYSLHQLYERAKEYGCYEPLRNVFVSLCWAIKEASLDMPIFPIFIILCARRPCDLIGDDSSLELIPYVVECHVEDAQLPFSESAIRIRKDSPVFPLGHRHALTSNLLRRMSGGTDTMKDGHIVHIGCGSVGSKIAMHLARSGYGPFKLIDKAAFSPHNVARHALIPVSDIPGQPKASFLAEQIKMLRTEAEPYNDDIATLCQRSDIKTLVFPHNTRLVIESTGSIAVRELLVALSPKKLAGRLLHAALYESGRIGIMAFEGRGRNPNVCDLVIRYWDERVDNHDIRSKLQIFSDEMSRQEVGLGCGSHTMVMADTRVSLYAAGIAERARHVLEGGANQNGELWIGTLEANELQVSWRLVELGQTKVLSVKAKNKWEIRILEQALDQISKEAERYEEIETGGVLIGRISLTRRCFTVARVIEAPPDSKRSQSSFVLGTQGLKKKVKEIHDKSSGFLNYVGTWHSHPKGGEPSILDKDSLERMKRLRFGAPAIGLIWMPSGFKAIIDEGKLS